METLLNKSAARISALQLLGAGCGCLDSTIRCANSMGTPIDLDRLRLARDLEQHSAGCRLTIIRMLDREIRRQEKAQAKAA